MATKTYAITQHMVNPPATGKRFLVDPSSPLLYARIECWGAAGESMVLNYLRPDSTYPFDTAADGGPRPNVYDAGADVAHVYRFAHEFEWDRNLLASSQQAFAEVDSQLPGGMTIFASVQLLPQTSRTVPDVLQWLAQHPAIAEAIGWQNMGATTLTQFPAWTVQQKQGLADAFANAWNAVPSAIPDPPPALGADPNEVIIDPAHAWGLYLQHVAHSLALEMGAGVPWSLAQLARDDRERILSGAFMFGPLGGGVRVKNFVVPASPLFAYSFLRRNDLVGASRLDTIARVLAWCRRHLSHFFDDLDTAPAHWQYPGVPARRVIEGTVHSTYPEYGRQHWTAGCMGTSQFLRCLLRVVNIPVEKAFAGGHAMPWFTSEARWLSHGDDPYNRLAKATPQYPASELLIDQAKFDGWFGPNVPAAQQQANVGRRVVELALQYLPDELLHVHWQDQLAGRTPANSTVYDTYLKKTYPDLNAILPLWPAMEDKLTNFSRMGYALLQVRLPLWVTRFLPPWVPVLLQRIPLLAIRVEVPGRSR